MSAKPYQVSWTSAKDLKALNRKLAVQLNQIDAMLTDLYTNQQQIETGTWSPTDLSGAALTFTRPSGHYWKLGSLVILSGFLVFPSTASGATARIAGLPFTVNKAFEDEQPVVAVSWTSESTLVRGWISTTSGFEHHIIFITSTGGALTNSTLSGDSIYFTAIYRTAT